MLNLIVSLLHKYVHLITLMHLYAERQNIKNICIPYITGAGERGGGGGGSGNMEKMRAQYCFQMARNIKI